MKNILWILGAVALLATSCKKDDDDTTTTPTTGSGVADFSLHFHPMAGMEDFSTSSTYTTPDDWNYNIELSQFYVSGIELWKDALGTEKLSLDSVYLLVKPSQMSYELGEIPSGTYYGVDFNIGIADSAVNHGDPSAATGVLAPQSPSMHWSWNSGYIFVKIEGNYADSTDKTGSLDHHYELHVGMDSMVRSVSLSKEFTVTEDVASELMIMVDHTAVFETIDFSQDSITHTMDNMPLAMEVANNLANAFSTEM